jgi:AcrR family transcriptional regulator
VSDSLSRGAVPRLADRRNDLTREIILEAALATLERGSVEDLTVRAVAQQANISERTVFRYFADRDALLDAIAGALRARLDLPPAPCALDALTVYPGALYRRFEAQRSLTVAALHSDLYPRMVESEAKERWNAVRALLDEAMPTCPPRARKIAAANIRYYLAASTWYYYRFRLHLGIADTVACAETAIRDTLAGLSRP